MQNNAYNLMKDMWELDEKIQKLTEKLKNTPLGAERTSLEKQIDSMYADFLKYKHLLEATKVTV